MSEPILAGLAGERYINLETYRRDGTGVRTPVWFAVSGDGRLFLYSAAEAGKVKRIRRSPAARVAACNARGSVTGAWIDARASLAAGTEADHGMRLLNAKYWPWKGMLDLWTSLFPRKGRVVIVLTGQGAIHASNNDNVTNDTTVDTSTVPDVVPSSRR